MAQHLDAALELLDRQLVGSDGRLVGKVDDLELTDPSGDLEQPQVTAILTGPEALTGRLHTPLGRWLQQIGPRLLAPASQGPSRVSFQQVETIDSSIRLRLAADQLGTGGGQGWARRLLGKLPGAAMRLSELLGAEVVDDHGRAVGKVHDVRLEQAGRELQGFGPSLQVEGLIVGRRALGARFGFGRGGVRGPWLLKSVFGALGHDGRYVAWDRIGSIRDRQIRITGTADDLPRPQPLG